jgi:guanylate kinase
MESVTKRPLRVFLCHASDDKEIVRVLYNKLKFWGIDVWFDEENILPGQDWRLEISKAVYKADVVLICISNNSTTKEGYIQREIKFALDVADEKPEGVIYIIPLRLEECKVPRQLQNIQWVDLYFQQGDFDKGGFDKLMQGLNARSVNVDARLPEYQPLSDFKYSRPNPEPLIIVISGPAGVGKDSVVDTMKEKGIPFHFVVTANTRPKREFEAEGIDYFFVSKDEFARLIEENELLEYALVYNDYKGIPKQQIRNALKSGKDVIMRIDVQGARTIKNIISEAVLVFLKPKNENELINRLKKRNPHTEDLPIRMAYIRRELERVDEFDYVVENRDGCLDETVNIIQAIIYAEHHRVHHRKVVL